MNPATIYLSKWPKSRDTYKTMLGALELVVQVLGGDEVEAYPWQELRYETARAIPALLAEKKNKKGRPLAVPTINKSLVALRGVLESAMRAGQMPNEAYQLIEIRNAKGKSKHAGRALSIEETDKVLKSLAECSSQEAALIALLCATGMRRVELVRLVREDLNRETHRVTVKGKGDKVREIPIAPRWLPLIEPWWDQLESGAVAFTGFNSNEPMSRRTVSYIVETFCADFSSQRFTPHDLRRTFATRVCENADIGIASTLLGHSSIDTTALYSRRGKKAEDDAVKGI